jgi:hypothetical protein
MRWPIVWLLALIGAVVLGCGHGQGNNGGGHHLSPEQAAALENQLRSKPPLEAAQQQYRAAVQQTADQIAALVPGTTWQTVQDTWTDCGGDYVWTRAKEAYFLIGFSGPIPDDKWAQAVQILRNTANQFGANDFGVVKDNPGDHDVYVRGPDGVQFQLSSQKAGALTARSDCRMSQNDTATTPSTPHP